MERAQRANQLHMVLSDWGPRCRITFFGIDVATRCILLSHLGESPDPRLRAPDASPIILPDKPSQPEGFEMGLPRPRLQSALSVHSYDSG